MRHHWAPVRDEETAHPYVGVRGPHGSRVASRGHTVRVGDMGGAPAAASLGAAVEAPAEASASSHKAPIEAPSVEAPVEASTKVKKPRSKPPVEAPSRSPHSRGPGRGRGRVTKTAVGSSAGRHRRSPPHGPTWARHFASEWPYAVAAILSRDRGPPLSATAEGGRRLGSAAGHSSTGRGRAEAAGPSCAAQRSTGRGPGRGECGARRVRDIASIHHQEEEVAAAAACLWRAAAPRRTGTMMAVAAAALAASRATVAAESAAESASAAATAAMAGTVGGRLGVRSAPNATARPGPTTEKKGRRPATGAAPATPRRRPACRASLDTSWHNSVAGPMQESPSGGQAAPRGRVRSTRARRYARARAEGATPAGPGRAVTAPGPRPTCMGRAAGTTPWRARCKSPRNDQEAPLGGTPPGRVRRARAGRYARARAAGATKGGGGGSRSETAPGPRPISRRAAGGGQPGAGPAGEPNGRGRLRYDGGPRRPPPAAGSDRVGVTAGGHLGPFRVGRAS